jgi:hypothetical protein
MTAYGPPGGPPGTPPPPPGSYGSSSATRPDPKSVNPLDWGILGAGLLALIFSFFSFYSYDATGEAKTSCSDLGGAPAAAKDLCSGDSASAWHGFFGWFGVLLLVVAAVVVAISIFAPQVSLPFPARLVALALSVVAIISLLITIAVIPDWPPVADIGVNDSQYDKVIDNGLGFSYWIVLILAVIIAVLSFLRFQQTGGELPGRTASAGGAHTPPQGGAPQGGAPQGYAPPPQQGPPAGYAPPPQQGPPAGYAPPPQQGYSAPPPQQEGPVPGYGQNPQQQGPPPGYSAPPPPQ